MAKPTRKHPGFSSMVVSPQGVEFVKLIHSVLGPEVAYAPLATFDRGRRHLFTLHGWLGNALLSEAWEEPEGSEGVARWAFTTRLGNGLELWVTLDARRWDPGQERVVTGQDRFAGVSARKRQELEAQRRFEIGAAKDRVTRNASDTAGASWLNLSGISRDIVEKELERNGIRVSVFTSRPVLEMRFPAATGTLIQRGPTGWESWQKLMRHGEWVRRMLQEHGSEWDPAKGRLPTADGGSDYNLNWIDLEYEDEWFKECEEWEAAEQRLREEHPEPPSADPKGPRTPTQEAGGASREQ
jgi:hypothetical protein